MRAAVYRAHGDPDVVRIEEVPEPTAGPGEVSIEVCAAALNPKDVLLRKGRFALLAGRRFPKRVGFDVAGIVRDLGPGVDRALLGARVMGFVDGWRGTRGTLAERVVLPAAHLARVGDGVDLVRAAGIPLAGSTALAALRDHGRVGRGQRVCIVGASGGVGVHAVQIAKLLGAHVTAVSSAANADFVRALGADRTVDYASEDPFAERGAFDVVVDAFGRTRLDQASAGLVARGTFVAIVPSRGAVLDVLGAVVGKRRARFVLVRPRALDLELLGRWAADGALLPPVDFEFTFDRIPDAMRRVETRRARGKVVVRVSA